MNIHRTIAALCLAALLTACGGSGGSGDNGTVGVPAPVVSASTGVFVAIRQVAGIGYATATQSGKTNAKGEFLYLPGETITFSIGAIEFPPVAANVTVTPLDIANSRDYDNRVVRNILVLLKSLDEDSNPANGIAIPAAAAAKATSGVNFDVNPVTFRANPAVTSLVADSGSVNKLLLDGELAKNDFILILYPSEGFNVAPTANAGVSRSLPVGSVFTLDGSESWDANPTQSSSYAWTLTSKPAASNAVLSGATSVNPAFTADVAGTYVATLVVSDGTLYSTPSTVILKTRAGNVAPVANAGPAQTLYWYDDSVVTLDGSASSDADGDALSYKWGLITKPISDSSSNIVYNHVVNPTFRAMGFGTYVASLIVSDGRLDSAPATVTIVKIRPVPIATVEQNAVVGDVVTLDGTSRDPLFTGLRYTWVQEATPVGSSATLSATTSVKTTFTADVPGIYSFRLLADADGKSTVGNFEVTVTAR